MLRFTVPALVVLALVAPLASAQAIDDRSACATLNRTAPAGEQWISADGKRTLSIDLTFRTDSSCAATRSLTPCAPSQPVSFRTDSTPTGIERVFTANPVPLGADTTARTTLKVTANSQAPRFSANPLPLTATCAGVSAALTLTIIVDEPYSADAKVLSSSTNRTALTWTLELTGKGGGSGWTTLTFAPQPQRIDTTDLAWTVPDNVDLAYNDSSPNVPHRQQTKISVDTRRTDLNFSIALTPSFNGDPTTTGTPILVALPTASFTGRGSPAFEAAGLGIALAAVWCTRRARTG